MVADPFTIPLGELRRGPVERSWRLEADGTALGELPAGVGAVDVRVEATGMVDEGVRVRGRLATTVRASCRRCTEEVLVDIDAPLDVWFRPEDEATPDEEAVWPLNPGAGVLELAAPLREEIWLAVPDYLLCRDDCPGLCPRCGADLGAEPCRCPPPEPDARWAALEAIRVRDSS